MDLQAFHALIHSQADKATWSKGVSISRRDAVTADGESDSEIKLRVLDRDRNLNFQVELFPDDEDWVCDCKDEEDPCVHVVAAVIALKLAQSRQGSLPRSHSSNTKLVYELVKEADIFLRRWLVFDNGKRSALEGGLGSVASLVPTKDDMAIDVFLARYAGRIKDAEYWRQILAHLSNCEMELNGVRVNVGEYQRGAVAIVDHGDEVALHQDESLGQSLGRFLRFDGANVWLETKAELPRELQGIVGKVFSKPEWTRLLSEVIPKLEAHVRVEVRTNRLGERAAIEPQIALRTHASGAELVVEVEIAYGSPAIARVVDGELVAVADSELVPKRRRDIEERVLEEFARATGLDIGVSRFRGSEAVETASRLSRWRGLVSGAGVDSFTLHDQIRPRVEWTPEGLIIDFETHDKTEVGFSDVWDSYLREEPYVKLLSGGYAPIPEEWLESNQAVLGQYLELRQLESDAGDVVRHWRSAQLADELSVEVPSGILEGLRDKLEALDSEEIASPPDLQASLRDYQEVGVKWLRNLGNLGLGALLADDMGLGKTLQAISAISGKTLVVAPTSLISNWALEFERFRPSLGVCIYHGSQRRLADDFEVCITSYGLVRSDDRLLGRDWDTVILDEGQFIKNSESLTAKRVRALKGNRRMVLSGTPIENKLEDIWSLFAFLNPGLLGSLRSFKRCYGPESQLDGLRKLLKPFILRRRKEDVAKELPAKTEQVVFCDLSDHERAAYTAMVKDLHQEISAKKDPNMGFLLERLLRLRQICCHLALVPGAHEPQSTKCDVLLERLKELQEQGRKALVFSQWTAMLDLVEARLDCEWLRIDGTTKDRQEVVDSFQNGDASVLLMSLKAGGVGLNLTAAENVFLLDPWWNPAVERQAADRAHRIGQLKPVLVQKLIAKGTIEERILELQRAKERLGEDLISEGGGLSKEDLLAILDLSV